MYSVRRKVSCHQARLCKKTQEEGKKEEFNPIPDIIALPCLLSSLLHPGIEWLYKNVQCERQPEKKPNPDVRP